MQIFTLVLVALAQTAPDFPDLTHPDTLRNLGQSLLSAMPIGFILLGGLGGMLAWLNSSYGQRERPQWFLRLLERYGRGLGLLQHATLIAAVTLFGFLLCTTLANRYHHWEQARVSRVADTVSGDRLEHVAPRLRYVVAEPYTFEAYDRGRPVEVTRAREIPHFLTLSSSDVQVKLEQIQDPTSERLLYQAQVQANYQVRNPLSETTDFTFEAPPPSGYTLLQNYKLERDSQPLQQHNPGDYGFPLRLKPGETAKLRLTYQVQGGPRWVYNADGQLLSNFKLTAEANFANADFASGIIPTATRDTGRGKQFTWEFQDNVSVRNPFGVYTGTQRIRNRGLLPRLLLLAPLLFLWWVALLYLSVPLQLRDLLLAAGVFFALLLALTYLSRIADAALVWSLLAMPFLGLSWRLGYSYRTALAAVIATLSGAVVPVLGLLVSYSGLTLSLAGAMSVGWLALRHWHRPVAAPQVGPESQG